MTEPMNSGNSNSHMQADTQGQTPSTPQGNQGYAGQAPVQGFAPQGFGSAPTTASPSGYGYQQTSQPYPPQQYPAMAPGYGAERTAGGLGFLFSFDFGRGPKGVAARTVHLLAVITGAFFVLFGLVAFIESFVNSQYYGALLLFKSVLGGLAYIALGFFLVAFSRVMMGHVAREENADKQA